MAGNLIGKLACKGLSAGKTTHKAAKTFKGVEDASKGSHWPPNTTKLS
jgi:hypothetical protein